MRTDRSRANWLASALLLSVAPIGLAASPAALAAPAASGDVITPPQVAAVAARVAAAAQAEVADKQIPSIAIALVDRSGVVWQQAWGDAGAADSLYRAGSVTKLLTDVAVMKLVEQGRLDLDAPVTRYLPDFHPHNPFGAPITLRQLMTHRSGLVREPPRGHYFDAATKGEADTVASLNQTTLVARPGTITKYSNAGIAVVGEVIARVMRMPYERAIGELVLSPLGMNASGLSRAALKHPVARAQMASFDGARFPAPSFDLGTPAAGSLYTNGTDLGRFVRMLLDRGALPGGKTLLRADTLEGMWRAQYPDGKYGLGFALGSSAGVRTVGHGGAVYGFATDVRLAPEAGVGVIVFSTVDAGTSARRLGDFALASLLAAQRGGDAPVWLRSTAIGGERAARLSGRFVDGDDSVNLRVYQGGLVLDAPEAAGEVREAGGRVLLDDAQTFDDRLALDPAGQWVEFAGRRYTRAEWRRPPPPDAELSALIGEYGFDHNILRIYQRDGKPYVRIEWTDWRPLGRVAADVYAFPADRGLYPHEQLRFERDRDGKVIAAMLGDIRFPRRDFGAEAEAAVRATMRSGIADLRRAALSATPPAEPPTARAADLVAIRRITPGIRLDIRYATPNNFTGHPIYESAGAFMQRPAAEALGRVQRELGDQGFGLLIHDAYRPWYVTKIFWDATPPQNRMFVADPSQGSRHNRGAAVDLTMIDLKTGTPIVTTGRYDEFSSRSYTDYVGGSDEQRWLREVLRRAMERNGFTVYPEEWWHFDLDGWQAYPIGNQTFEQLTVR
ncbi:serine hydrolase [Sphingomonas sp. MMSM20]|uniref:serine hydrolase n=1 Tax=Sphingomonas lycopersici TaxID=2951807 RepID=UPI002238BC5B|nr:serine hydrolase [Sphingomonas lycopersici]MCW6531025.1 serine hydrolase [Sphingomonas lycopersici]